MKKLLSVLLALLMLCTLCVPAFAVETVTHVEATVTGVVIGAKISALTAKSAEPEKYTVSIYDIYYSKGGDYYHPKADETFLAGVTYMVSVQFAMQTGYALDTGKATCKVNGEEMKSKSGTHTWYYCVVPTDKPDVPDTPQDETPPTAKCPWCDEVHGSGFFQRIIAWFHNLLAKLFKH